MPRACIRFILEHLVHFSGQYFFFCFYGLFEWERLASLSAHTLYLVLIVRVSPIDWISQQHDQFGIGYNCRRPSGGVRMEQVVWAGLSRDVRAAVTLLERKMGTIPIVAFSEVEIEVVYFLGKGWLHVRMLHQELVKKSSTTLLRSDDEKVGQRSYWSSSQSPKMPGCTGLLGASLHNIRFLSQARTNYKLKKAHFRIGQRLESTSLYVVLTSIRRSGAMHLPDGLVADPFSILQTNFFRERYFLRRYLNKSLPHYSRLR